MILGELAQRLGCRVRGDAAVQVHRVAAIDEAGAGDLTFVTSPRFAARLAATRASAVILHPDIEAPLPSLVTPNPYLTYARALAVLHPEPSPEPGVHPSAQVDATAQLGEDVHVGPLAVIGPRVKVGARTVLHPHVVLYQDVEIGEDCVLHSGVQVRERCRIGRRVIVQNGAVLGSDGFGFARDAAGRYEKILHIGTLQIGDDVEIGALTAIDRASLSRTRIGRGTKIDNLVQIGHSVTIGEDTILAGQVGIAGSAVLGDRVTLAGQVGVVGHLTIGDDVVATAQSGIPGAVEKGRVVSGSPAFDNRAWLKATAVFAKLPELQRRIRELERRLAERDTKTSG